jgi:hypothetical protein
MTIEIAAEYDQGESILLTGAARSDATYVCL